MPGALRLEGASATTVWSSGCAQYWIERDTGEHLLVVAARCRLGTLGVEDLALVDTGAQWSVVGGELVELLAEDLHDRGPSMKMSTRFGLIEGSLSRLVVTLVADEGRDVEISSTVLVAPGWQGPPVIGYRGLLERVRIALDPGVGDDDQWMYFGSAA